MPYLEMRLNCGRYGSGCGPGYSHAAGFPVIYRTGYARREHRPAFPVDCAPVPSCWMDRLPTLPVVVQLLPDLERLIYPPASRRTTPYCSPGVLAAQLTAWLDPYAG